MCCVSFTQVSSFPKASTEVGQGRPGFCTFPRFHRFDGTTSRTQAYRWTCPYIVGHKSETPCVVHVLGYGKQTTAITVIAFHLHSGQHGIVKYCYCTFCSYCATEATSCIRRFLTGKILNINYVNITAHPRGRELFVYFRLPIVGSALIGHVLEIENIHQWSRGLRAL